MENNINSDVMKSVWAVEQEILDIVDLFCRKNNIKYSLGYGTLLGAIRHHGFIPWDDDIDIIMPREDYDKFIKLWKKENIDGFILQDEYNPPLDYPENFCKVRKNNTAFIQSENEIKKRFQKGIFIDIFPADRVAPKKISRYIQLFWFCINMLFSREHPDKSKGFIGVIERILLLIPKRMHHKIKMLAVKKMIRWNSCNTQFVAPFTMTFCKKYFPSDMFDELIEIEFNKKKYLCTSKWDGFLKSLYGDYMKLPPESERVWKHSPIIIYLDKNYD